GTTAARFECIETAQRANDGVVDQIRGVGCAPRPTGKAAVRPALELRKIAAEERGDGPGVATPRAGQKRPGRVESRAAAAVRGRSTRRHETPLVSPMLRLATRNYSSHSPSRTAYY